MDTTVPHAVNFGGDLDAANELSDLQLVGNTPP